jgi:hypothetical protein
VMPIGSRFSGLEKPQSEEAAPAEGARPLAQK